MDVANRRHGALGAGLWLRKLHQSPHPRLRLICLPDVGEPAAVYRDLADGLPTDIELWAVELPGRGLRRAETALKKGSAAISGICRALLAETEPGAPLPVVLFGRGLGASLAVEVARWFAERELPETPVRLFLAGEPHPSREQLARLDGAELVDELWRIGGQEMILDRVVLGELSLDTLRSDFALAEDCPTHAPVDVPITAFEDISGDQRSSWPPCTTEPVELLEVRAGGRVLDAESMRIALRSALDRSGPPAVCGSHVA